MSILEHQPAEGQFLAARREWDDRYSNLAKGKRNWQILCLVIGISNAILIAGIVRLSTQSRIVPYVVEVDRVGRAVALGPAEAMGLDDERLVRHQLAFFLRNARTVIGDHDAQTRMIQDAYAFARGAAAETLNRRFRHLGLLSRQAQTRVAVEIEGLLPLGEAAWQLNWREITTEPDGRRRDPVRYQAVVTFEHDPPRDTTQVLVNPLGIYVTEIQWTEVL